MASQMMPAVQAQRSVTLPIRHTESVARRTSSNTIQEPTVDTLLQLPSVRIVSFTASSPHKKSVFARKASQDVDEEEEIAGTLPWNSRMERTIAVGPLRIYKAPGSVAFINCGPIVQAILPKSRCWCVDDESSNFVLQKRKPEYWRIEVPVAAEEDRARSEKLKAVFEQILLFEKTVCPFRRSFTIELDPRTPIKKRPWKPVERPTQEETRAYSVASEDVGEGEDYYTEIFAEHESSFSNYEFSERGSDTDGTDDTNATPRNRHRAEPPCSLADLPIGANGIRARRSVTAPPQLTLITSPPSKQSRSRSPLHRISSRESTESDLSSSVESFHSVQSWHSPITPLPPSPPQSKPTSPQMYPYPHENIALPKRTHHVREISEMTITPELAGIWETSRPSSPEASDVDHDLFSTPSPSTPYLVDDIEVNLDEEHFEIAAPSTQNVVRRRPTTGNSSRRRALSPLPPAANIFSPPRRRRPRLQTARHIPTAILQKTCEILLSPPSHLLHLMLDIAARIAAGEWRDMVFNYGESGEKNMGPWDYYDGDLPGTAWEEDDYGIRVNSVGDARRLKGKSAGGGSWEVD